MNGQMNFTNASIPISSVINSINTVNFGGLDLQPSYQRGFIWKEDFKDKLLYSIIKQYPTGNISVRVLNIPNAKGAKSEVVDGQQRLTTIRDFVKNGYVIRSEWSRKIIEVIESYYKSANVKDDVVNKLVDKLKNKGNPRIKYNDLPEIIKGNISAYNIPMTYIAEATDMQIREYFRFLQNQERLRAGEIINSMPPTVLEYYMEQINHKNLFLDKICFVDNRAEFEKIFYSIVGLFDLNIQLGSTDLHIQNYCSKAKELTLGLQNTNNMIEQINFITKNNVKLSKKTRKRYLKFFLLLSGFGMVDFKTNTEKKLNRLKEIDDRLSVFFSAKANSVENEFKGVSSNIVEELRQVALISKGAHPLTRVKERMGILAYYINADTFPKIAYRTSV